MSWQDIVLTFGTIIFSIALIPTLRGKEKPALSSSLITGIVLAIFAGVYVTLSLWLSTLFTGILSLVWLTLAWQKYQQETRRQES